MAQSFETLATRRLARASGFASRSASWRHPAKARHPSPRLAAKQRPSAMPEPVWFAALVVGVLVVGLAVGMLVAPRIGRLGEPPKEPRDPEDRAD